MTELKYVGKRVPIHDAVEKVTGKLKYTGDMDLTNMLTAKILFSPIPHGRIKRIDTSKAEKLPGVAGVFTYQNSPQIKYNTAVWFLGQQGLETEVLFTDVVRFVGDRVAAVVAIDADTANQALSLIEVEYEELPFTTSPEEALLEGFVPIHPGGNLAKEVSVNVGDIDKAFQEEHCTFQDAVTTQRVHHCAMENHVCVADCHANGKVTVWTPCQNVFAVRLLLCKVLSLPSNKVRVIKNPVGGSFGGKLEPILEPIAAFLAQQVRKPVKLELTRKENIISTKTRHATNWQLKTAVTNTGKLVGTELQVVANTGAYANNAEVVALAMSRKATRLYQIPNYRYTGKSVYTNAPLGGAMRGYGSPQLFTALEIHYNHIALALGMDPLEFRLQNLLSPHGIDGLSGRNVGNCRIKDCVKEGAKAFGWDEKKLDLGPNPRFKRGIGVGCGNHVNGLAGAYQDFSSMTMRLNEDGSITLITGAHDMGCGTCTIFSQIVAEVIDIPPEQVLVIEGDTDISPYDLGTQASRTAFVSGNAVKKVAELMKDLLLAEAAKIFEAAPEELVLAEGYVTLTGSHKRLSLGEIGMEAQTKGNKPLVVTDTYQSFFNPGAYGAHFAQVEVDTETGAVKVLEYVAAHDVGRALNKMLIEGQIEGAVQMCLGLALKEEILVDPETGKVTNAHLRKYQVFKAKDMPKTKVVLIEQEEETGPFGAKSIGEIAAVPGAAAIVNGVNNALGTRLTELPLTPDKILAALRKEK
ncbi:MAG: molybdopterin cofactor-binding domain-containing protein [Bacillota bacterium]|nr:molybdopterin cofactor-binding domain-containing protein [Bacillota bacterium]